MNGNSSGTYFIQNTNIVYGWVCAKCGRSNAPDLDTCPCFTNITINSPNISVGSTCQHEYPNPWHGITPPVCKKCNQPAYVIFPQVVSTYSTSPGDNTLGGATFKCNNPDCKC